MRDVDVEKLVELIESILGSCLDKSMPVIGF